MKNVLASAAEAELGDLFFNAREGEGIHQTLVELCYLQPLTPITINNLCTVGIANSTVK